MCHKPSHNHSIHTCTCARFPRIVDGDACAAGHPESERKSRPRRKRVSKLASTKQLRKPLPNTPENFSRALDASQFATFTKHALTCQEARKRVQRVVVLAVAFEIYLAVIRINWTYLAWARPGWCSRCGSLSTRNRVAWHSVLWVAAVSSPVRSWLCVHGLASVLWVTVLHLLLRRIRGVLLAGVLRVGWARRGD